MKPEDSIYIAVKVTEDDVYYRFKFAGATAEDLAILLAYLEIAKGKIMEKVQELTSLNYERGS